MNIHLQILTPQKSVVDEEAQSVSVPAADGELTILPEHVHLLTVLKEGVVTIRKGGTEEFLAIGGGYLETDGKELRILVSRAYGQDEVDETMTKKAMEQAQKVMKEAPETAQRQDAMLTIRKSLVDIKLLRKRKRRA